MSIKTLLEKIEEKLKAAALSISGEGKEIVASVEEHLKEEVTRIDAELKNIEDRLVKYIDDAIAKLRADAAKENSDDINPPSPLTPETPAVAADTSGTV